jgi:glucose/arabinose dehydrogenase
MVSFGRFYLGPRVNPKIRGRDGAADHLLGATIATSGLSFYTGDKFPNWKNNRSRAVCGRVKCRDPVISSE